MQSAQDKEGCPWSVSSLLVLWRWFGFCFFFKYCPSSLLLLAPAPQVCSRHSLTAHICMAAFDSTAFDLSNVDQTASVSRPGLPLGLVESEGSRAAPGGRPEAETGHGSCLGCCVPPLQRCAGSGGTPRGDCRSCCCYSRVLRAPPGRRRLSRLPLHGSDGKGRGRQGAPATRAGRGTGPGAARRPAPASRRLRRPALGTAAWRAGLPLLPMMRGRYRPKRSINPPARTGAFNVCVTRT